MHLFGLSILASSGPLAALPVLEAWDLVGFRSRPRVLDLIATQREFAVQGRALLFPQWAILRYLHSPSRFACASFDGSPQDLVSSRKQKRHRRSAYRLDLLLQGMHPDRLFDDVIRDGNVGHGVAARKGLSCCMSIHNL